MNSVRIVKKNGFEYLQFNKLLEFENLIHAFSLKTYETNFENSVKSINENYKKICNEFDINREQIIQPIQKHTDNILEIQSIEQAQNEIKETGIDGLITNKTNIMTIVKTADCIPLILYDPKNKVFANIHSGWQGTCKKIGIKALNFLINKYQTKPENVICCFAPCIHKDNFLVNEDVLNIYIQSYGKDLINKGIVEETSMNNEKGRIYKVDNIALYSTVFREMGVINKNLIDSGICTAKNKDICYSFRANKDTKRHGLMIMLK